MKEVIKALEDANLRSKVKVVIGGAPITQTYAEDLKVDAYATDAATAVDKIKEVLHI